MFKNALHIAAVLLSISTVLAGNNALAQAASSNTATTYVNEFRDPNRVFRRIIFEGSLINAGFDGGDASRYSKPNGFNAGALLDLLGTGDLVLETGAMYRQLGTTVDNGFG